MFLSDMVLDVFLSWSGVSAGHSDLGSDISAEEDLHGSQAYNQHEKGLAL